MNHKPYVTLSEVAKVKGKSVETWKKRCQNNQIPGAFQAGESGAWLIPTSFIYPDTLGNDYFLGSLIDNPLEYKNLDCKTAKKFKAKTGYTEKIIKHILAFANAGGGYLIFGIKEKDGKYLYQDPIEPNILSSFDQNIIGNHLSSYIKGSKGVQIFVHKVKKIINDTEYVFPIIKVLPDGMPFFCSKDFKIDGKQILESGALYVRNNQSGSVKLANPEDWTSLIDVVIDQRKSEFMKSISSVMDNFGVKSPTILSIGEKGKKWYTRQRKDLLESLKDAKIDDRGFLIAGHWLENYEKNWTGNELNIAATNSKLPNTGWPIGLVLHREGHSPFETDNGEIKTVINALDGIGAYDTWTLSNDGSYFFSRLIAEDRDYDKDNRVVFFDTRIWRIVELIEHALKLYEELGVPGYEKITIKVEHLGIKDRTLTSGNTRRLLSMVQRTSKANSSTYVLTNSIDEIRGNLDIYVKEIANSLFSKFDFMRFNDEVIKSVIDEYRNSRL